MNGWTTPLRLAFGAFLVLHGLNHFFALLYAEPGGTMPLAVQLMSAFRHSHLLDVVMGIQIAAGVLIVGGLAVPFALAAAMPISVCALFWALGLEHDPLWSALALLAIAADAALMLAYLPAYRGVLERRALALGEGPTPGDNYDGVYMHIGPREGLRTARYAAAAAIVLAALVFYAYFVPSATGRFAMYVILVPALLLMVRGAGVSRRA